ncbi:MAG: ELM1/GtrOC1 family putative glycosyltransferase [Rickettsiales bacterium]
MIAPLVWLTKTATAGDTQARIGIAEQLGATWQEFSIPTTYCTDQQVFDRLVVEGLIDRHHPLWPDVIIGRSVYIPYLRVIKRLSSDKSLLVAMRPPTRDLPIQASQAELDATDIICSYPHHDNSRFPQTLLCPTVPNRVTPSVLLNEKEQWLQRYAAAASRGPIIGVCMGGHIGVEKRRLFSPALAAQFGEHLNQIAQHMGASIIATMSRRTPSENVAAWRSAVRVPCDVYSPETDPPPNPYFGLLAFADYLVVTADSLSMCCETTATGKPVYIFCDDSILEEGHQTMLDYLIEHGHARRFCDRQSLEPFAYKPHNSANDIANAIRRCLVKHPKVLIKH